MDPMDYWDYSQNLKPDFYSPNVFWDTNINKYRGFIKVFWREADRVIQDYRGEVGVTRITGPTYPIEFQSDDGINFTKISEDPIVPTAIHKRLGYDAPWTTGGYSLNTGVDEPTCPTCSEVGQLSALGGEIEFLGNKYIFYGYRDDIHYENPSYVDVERSLYIYAS